LYANDEEIEGAKLMSAEENKARVRRLMEEGVNQGNSRVIDELIAPNFAIEGEMSAEGPEGFKAVAAVFRTAFPDGRFVLEEIVGEGDTVVTWAYFTGTHTGPLDGIPPTGKTVQVKDVDLYELENGKVVRMRAHFDQLGMMQQLGVLGGAQEGSEL
jgi:steroid delta-isomerase-like uncharacterized protein